MKIRLGGMSLRRNTTWSSSFYSFVQPRVFELIASRARASEQVSPSREVEFQSKSERRNPRTSFSES